jgi:hypothetical protein
VLWWGDVTGGTLLPLRPAATAAAAGAPGAAVAGQAADAAAAVRFGVCCGPRLLAAYLADAGTLTLTLEDAFCGLLGEAAVPLAPLAAGSEVTAAVPVMACGGGSGGAGADAGGAARRGGDARCTEGPGVDSGSAVNGAAACAAGAVDAAGFPEGASPGPGPELASGRGSGAIATLAVRLRVTYPTGAPAPADAPSHPAAPDAAQPEAPRCAAAVPAPLPRSGATGSPSGVPPDPGKFDTLAEIGAWADGTSPQRPADGSDAGTGWTGHGYPLQQAYPGGACLGAVPAAYLAAWQGAAAQRPPAWPRQGPPSAALPILASAWPAYAPQPWLSPYTAAAVGPGPAPGSGAAEAEAGAGIERRTDTLAGQGRLRGVPAATAAADGAAGRRLRPPGGRAAGQRGPRRRGAAQHAAMRAPARASSGE